jgi:uncharacterized protein
MSLGKTHRNMKTKEYILLLLILLLTIALPTFNAYATRFEVSEDFSALINKQLVYQLSTLLLTLLFLTLLWKLKRKEFIQYFRRGNISAPITPAPFVGIKPKKNENWLHLGKSFSVIITLVTMVVIYLQVIHKNTLDYSKILTLLPIAIGLSLVNSFVEESITRLGIVATFKNIIPDNSIMILSGLLFGGVHYLGTPGGVTGVFVAGFLGWFLAKSILETKGFFWAWLIHFLQDIVIFTAMLSTE